jgi:hypothetical protein
MPERLHYCDGAKPHFRFSYLSLSWIRTCVCRVHRGLPRRLDAAVIPDPPSLPAVIESTSTVGAGAVNAV